VSEPAQDERVVIGARRRIGHSREDVFALLTDLRRHWPLLGADLVEADLVDGAGGVCADRFPGFSAGWSPRSSNRDPMTCFAAKRELAPRLR